MAIVGLDLSEITGSKRRYSFIEKIDELQNKHFGYSVFERENGIYGRKCTGVAEYI